MMPGNWPAGSMLALVFLVGAAVCALGLRASLRSAWRDRWLDQPNHRSMHTAPTPRFGGLGLMAGAAAGVCVAQTMSHGLLGQAGSTAVLLVLVASLPLILIGALDDRRSLPVLVRLPVHLGASVVVAALLLRPPAVDLYAGLAVLLAALLIAWFANLYNFMDGADGLAGLMATIGFLTLALLAPVDSLMAIVCTSLAGASAGFLTLNWAPARVFMGDAGAIPLGFLAGGLGLAGAVAGYWPWWTPLGVFLPFVLDASVTLARRLLTGRRIWLAHREHLYQRLILRGWSHRQVAMVYGGWMLACSLATATVTYADMAVSITTWAVILLAYLSMLRLAASRASH